ncbi:hypothetical protein C1147_13600 [Clostridium botulinum]|nr:hypothetical protein C1147_13600 [Clostridium botulinum]RFM21506.1 hypothetical protein C1146_08895 [Clostridium botulinum]
MAIFKYRQKGKNYFQSLKYIKNTLISKKEFIGLSQQRLSLFRYSNALKICRIVKIKFFNQ